MSSFKHGHYDTWREKKGNSGFDTLKLWNKRKRPRKNNINKTLRIILLNDCQIHKVKQPNIFSPRNIITRQQSRFLFWTFPLAARISMFHYPYLCSAIVTVARLIVGGRDKAAERMTLKIPIILRILFLFAMFVNPIKWLAIFEEERHWGSASWIMPRVIQ